MASGGKKPRVLVTGATGFAGTHLVPLLCANGWTVRATGRDASRSPTNCEFIAADLEKMGDLRDLVEDCQAVIHLAARVHVMKETAKNPMSHYRESNVGTSLRLAEAACQAGVRQFIFASSVKVNGETTTDQPLTENSPCAPIDPYGVSKAEAEQALLRFNRSAEMKVTVLRLPLMYGPGVGGNFRRIVALTRLGIPIPLEGINNRRSMLFIGNFSSATLAVLQSERDLRGIYLLSDGEDVSTPELVRRIANSLGRKARLFRLPPSLLKKSFQMLGMTQEFQRLTASLQIDSSKIRAALGWQPPHTLSQGLTATTAPNSTNG